MILRLDGLIMFEKVFYWHGVFNYCVEHVSRVFEDVIESWFVVCSGGVDIVLSSVRKLLLITRVGIVGSLWFPLKINFWCVGSIQILQSWRDVHYAVVVDSSCHKRFFTFQVLFN